MENIIANLSAPWPWYVAGPLIGLTVPLLLLIGSKAFGISSNLRHICAACLPARIPYFRYEWKRETWNLFFVAGIIIGAVICTQFLRSGDDLQLNEQLVIELATYDIKPGNSLVPKEIFSFELLTSLKGFLIIVVGGFLVGFGTRYAGGCTSGHSINGLANFQLPSLIATICFMVGGIVMANFILPYILRL